MPARKRLIPILLTASLLLQLATGAAQAASQSDATIEAAFNNERVGPSTSYLTDQVDPFGRWFRDKVEVIDPQSGGLSLSFTDFVLPGRNGLDLVLKRNYESAQSNLYTPQTSVDYDESCVDYPAVYYVETIPGYDHYHETTTTVWVPEQRIWHPPYTVTHTHERTYTHTHPSWGHIHNDDYIHIHPGITESHTETYTETHELDPGYWETIAGYEKTTTSGSYHWHPAEENWYLIQPAQTVCTRDYFLVNSRSTTTFRDSVNGLGAGWAFGFPTLERVGGVTYFHDGDGGTLQVDTSTESGFKEYPLLDKRYRTDTSFTVGSVTSSSAVTYKDGRQLFFAANGRILGIRDRYDNRITFEHTTLNGVPAISKITDTLGRIVTFTYSSTQVTVTAPGGRSWRYNLVGTEAGKYQLSSVIDPVGRQTSFTYANQTGNFSFLSKSNRNMPNVWSNLTSVTYPGGGQTTYTYADTIGNLGSDGTRQYYRVTSRQDLISEGGTTRTVQRAQHTYEGAPDGYPSHPDPANLPATYTYSATVTDASGMVTKQTFGNKGLTQRLESTSVDGLRRVVTREYDANKLPTRIVTTVTDSLGRQATTEESTIYDRYRDLLSQTDAQGATTTYTYEPTFHRATSVTQRQNSGGAEVKTLNTIGTKGNVDRQTQVHSEDGLDRSIVTDFLYDTYGNLTESRLQMADETVQTKRYAYDVQGAYLTSEAQSYTKADGTQGTATTSYTYQAETGLQTKRTDPMGQSTSIAYDLAGRVTSITFPTVAEVTPQRTFVFDDNLLTSSYTDENEHQTVYTYDQLGRIRTVQRTLGGTTHTVLARQYDAAGNVASETDANGHMTQFAYDAQGRVTETSLPDGGVKRVRYEDAARQVIETDPNGNESVTQKDVMGREIAIQVKPNRLGATVYERSFTYDWLNNKLSETDPAGNRSTFTYDDLNRQVQKRDAAGNLTTVTYDNAGNAVREVGPLGRTFMHQYDAANRRMHTTDPMNGETRFEYDAKGRQTAVINPLGAKTAYAFDGLDRPIQVTDALGRWTSYTYDAVGNQLTITDARGKTTTTSYDEWNRQTASVDPLNARTEFAYDLNGNQTRQTNPEGRSTYFGYDSLNRLITETNSAGVATATHTYDLAGNRTSTTDARGEVTRFRYDGLNRLTKTEHPDHSTSESEYDAAGNMTATVDGNGNRTTFTFNALQQLTDVRDAAEGLWSYEVDPYGNMTKMTNPNRDATVYVYDGLNRQISTTDAVGNSTVAQYDAAGNLLFLQAGTLAPRTYTYDALNRLLSIQAGGSVSIQYTYDANGNRTSMIDGTGTTFYTYDDANRLIMKKVADGKQIAFTYNRAGQVTSLTDYGEKATLYAYDNVGRLAQATWDGQTATFGYDAAGNRTTQTLPGGVTVSYTYDSNNRLTSRVNRNGSGVLSRSSYTFDQAGNRNSETTLSGTTGYTYDKRNQLVAVSTPDGEQVSYSYDPAGNRLSKTDAGGTTIYAYDEANHLTQMVTAGGTQNFAWDAAGNQLSDGSLTYSYDGLDRLVGVSGAGTSIAYTYNGDSLLWERQEGGTQSRFYLNGDRVINEGSGAGALSASMFQTDFENLGRKMGSAAAYMLYNGHGDLTGVADGGGAQIAGYEYDAFGNLSAQTGGYATPFLYSGEYFDDSASLYFLRARFYSPELGRYVAKDTYPGSAEEPWTLHLYSYVSNNPVNFVDPTGHCQQPGNWGLRWYDPSSWSVCSGIDWYKPFPEAVAGFGADRTDALVSTGRTDVVLQLNRAFALHEGELPNNVWQALDKTITQVLFDMSYGAAVAGIFVAPTLESGPGPQATIAVRFTQTTASPKFSGEGSFAGQTIGQVAEQLRTGQLNPSNVPVQYVVGDGVRLIVNTRSSLALMRANVPVSSWTMINMTGDPLVEDAIVIRLLRNGLGSMGTEVLRITGEGQFKSYLE